MSKVALITGVTAQDGAYLAQLLLNEGYEVHGLMRPSSSTLAARADTRRHEPEPADGRVVMHFGDLTDSASVLKIVSQVQPDEIYNLGAQSHVMVSFTTAEYTANADALGTLRLLETVRILGLTGRTRYYQASTSELFGQVRESPQRETTPFRPRNPYGAAKLYGYWMTVNYREAYGLHASNGILYNHESPMRGHDYVTRKITRAAAAISLGLQDRLEMGNLDSRRDWGHARDYVRGMHLMLLQDEPGDYVLATGVTHSVREFVELAFGSVGYGIDWTGSGPEEVGRDARTGAPLIVVDPKLYQPAETSQLVGDPSRARDRLGWRHEVGFHELVNEMVQHDLLAARREAALRVGAA